MRQLVDTSAIFDESYYRGIWPDVGVHRHDYCDGLARQLIQRFGKVRFLDIGTGCGYLCYCLWKRGAMARGVEISEWALAHAHGDFVKRGDVRALPFPDKSFDVVHSNGLLEYIPEEDVDAAIRECLRVGGIQFHNYDDEDNLRDRPKDRPVCVKARSWWEEKWGTVV